MRTITVGGRTLVLWHRAGQASALDDATVAGGCAIGTVVDFEPVAGGRRLCFVASGREFTDAQTGSRWDVLGRATAGPLAGRRLAAYPFVDTFWFTWVALRPDTRLIR